MRPFRSSAVPHPDGAGDRAARVSPRARTRTVLAALAFTVVWAVLCNSLLDLTQSTRGAHHGLKNLTQEQVGVFVMSTAVVWVVLVAVVALTGRVLLSAGLVFGVVGVMAFANHEKLSLRQEPLYPSDLTFLGQAGFLKEMVGPGVLLLVAGGIAAVLAGLVVLARRVGTRFPAIRRSEEPAAWWTWTVGRVLALGLCAVLGIGLLQFNVSGNLVQKAYLSSGADWAPYSQRTNYRRNGFVAGLLYNLNTPAMDVPAGYSRATMADLVRRWRAETDRADAARGATPGALEDVNVVVVLSEAFSDPTRVRGVSLGTDPIPYTRSLMDTTTSGSMLTQLIGAGTANMEFEALTGSPCPSTSPR